MKGTSIINCAVNPHVPNVRDPTFRWMWMTSTPLWIVKVFHLAPLTRGTRKIGAVWPCLIKCWHQIKSLNFAGSWVNSEKNNFTSRMMHKFSNSRRQYSQMMVSWTLSTSSSSTSTLKCRRGNFQPSSCKISKADDLNFLSNRIGSSTISSWKNNTWTWTFSRLRFWNRLSLRLTDFQCSNTSIANTTFCKATLISKSK